jgi:hypothetical protein
MVELDAEFIGINAYNGAKQDLKSLENKPTGFWSQRTTPLRKLADWSVKTLN